MFDNKTLFIHPPHVILTDWRVFEVAAPGLEKPNFHLIGFYQGRVQVSPPIFDCDVVMRTCMTTTAELFQLLGGPSTELKKDAIEHWLAWTKHNGAAAISDITASIVAAFNRADEEYGVLPGKIPPAVPGGSVREEVRQRYQLCRRLATQYRRLHLHLSDTPSSRPDLPTLFVYQTLREWPLSREERRWMVDTLRTGSQIG